jgi:hypothetical protein
MPNERILPDIQRECEVRMNSDPFFNSISVLNYRKGDIAADLAACLTGLSPKNGLSGVCVIILQPVANILNNSVRFSQLEMQFSLIVVEYPLTNDDPAIGTGIRAETIIQRLGDLFGCFHPVGVSTPFVAEKPFATPRKDPIPLGAEGEFLLPISWECRLTTNSSRNRSVSIPDIPTITIAANVTITSATGAVDIYHTVDGTPPGPPAISPGSTLYTGPFAPPFSCTIRAVAMRQQHGFSWTPSDIASAEWDVELADNLGTPLAAQSEGGESIGV